MKVTVPVTRRVRSPLGNASIGKTVRAALIGGSPRKSRLLGMRGKDFEVGVIFVSDASMAKLNAKYRGKRKTTDVLSFSATGKSASVGGGRWPGTGERVLLGDVIVSVAQAGRQAKAASKPVRSELTLLLVHGVLHLMGFDHETRKQEKVMFPLQKRILKTLGHAPYATDFSTNRHSSKRPRHSKKRPPNKNTL